MKKKIIITLIILVLTGTIVRAADTELQDLVELTAIASADVLYVVDDPAGTPLSRKITALNLFDMIDTFAELNTITADKTLVNEEDAATWDALGTFGLGITITTGDPFTLGTNRIDNGSDLLDGEMIAADTIDDDSIDWADVTGVDITLTDCGAITSTGTITATVGFDIVGAADIDYGSADVTDHTFVEDGGTYIFNNGITAIGEDLGSATAEWNDLYLNDGGIIKLGNDQDVTITHVADTGILVNLEVEIDGTLDADGVVALGDGGDNFSVASDGIDIDTSGNITNAGTIASGIVTVTGVVNTSVGIDAVGAVDFDIGSADVVDVTIITDGGTLIIDNGITSVGEDIGSATAEWNDLFLNDGGVIQLGNDQDVTLTHVADTGVQVELDDKIMFGDTAVYIHSDDDGYLDIEADTGIRMDGPVDMQANALDLDSCTTTLSTVSGAIDAGGATSLEIPNGTDPDVTVVGQISLDTDGANEPNDMVLRTFEGAGTQYSLARVLKTIQATIIKPNDLADATRDLCPIWSNETGMAFNITKIEAWSDTDDTTVNVEVYDSVFGNNATVDALEIAGDGTANYYVTETTITAKTIAANYILVLDFDDTDDPGWVKISICGWFNSDVN